MMCNTVVCFPVAAGKLSDGLKEILEFCQTTELMLAGNVAIEGCCRGTRALSIPGTV